MFGARKIAKTLLGIPRPAALASFSASLLNKLPEKMELGNIDGARKYRWS